MPDISTLILFMGAALVLLITPGPAVLYVAARSVEQGRLAGMASVLGLSVGTIVHIFAAAFGLSAILMRSATAFDVVRYAGAAYLIWLGISALRSKETQTEVVVTPQPLSRVFRDGIAVNLLNPKTALFFLAFLPQFVRPERGSEALQIVVLGTVLLVLGFFTDSAYVMIAGSAGNWLRARMRGMRYVTGTVYLALGVTAAVSGRRR